MGRCWARKGGRGGPGARLGGALVGRNEDATIQPESVPVPAGRDGSERDQRARQWLLVGVRLDPPVLRELSEQRTLYRAAARGDGRDCMHCRTGRPGAGDGGPGDDRVSD